MTGATCKPNATRKSLQPRDRLAGVAKVSRKSRERRNVGRQLWQLDVVQVHDHLSSHRTVWHDDSATVISANDGVPQAQGLNPAGGQPRWPGELDPVSDPEGPVEKE